MSLHLSTPLQATTEGDFGFSVKRLDNRILAQSGGALVALDDFKVRGRPFPPHPHAGFAAVTYVFDDSEGGLRSADSLGNDISVGPGGIVWTHAGSGVLHHEVPSDRDRQLHGVQLFVNLSPSSKLTSAQTLWLDAPAVPEWHSERQDRVRIVVGEYRGILSPLHPPEAFTLLDVQLRADLAFDIEAAQRGCIYIESGRVEVAADAETRVLSAGQAIMVRGAGRVHVAAQPAARLLFLRSIAIDAPLVLHGPFIMNTQAQVADAIARYTRGEMGCLTPLPSE